MVYKTASQCYNNRGINRRPDSLCGALQTVSKKGYCMNDLTALQKRLREQRPVEWNQLPDFDGDDGLTAAMVNNYTKSGLAPRAEGKKYSREHLAYFTAICILKRVMSTRDMDLLIRQELQGERGIADGYAAFCGSLDQALNITAGELEQRAENGQLSDAGTADAAIHFALLSYAAGVASSRCVALLRRSAEKKEPGKKDGGKKEPGKKEKERD